MKKTLIALAILAFLIAMPFSYAAENETTYCADGRHLKTDAYWIFDGIYHSYNDSVYCAYGCDSESGTCNPSNWQKNMGVFGNLGMLPVYLIVLILFVAVIAVLKK